LTGPDFQSGVHDDVETQIESEGVDTF